MNYFHSLLKKKKKIELKKSELKRLKNKKLRINERLVDEVCEVISPYLCHDVHERGKPGDELHHG